MIRRCRGIVGANRVFLIACLSKSLSNMVVSAVKLLWFLRSLGYKSWIKVRSSDSIAASSDGFARHKAYRMANFTQANRSALHHMLLHVSWAYCLVIVEPVDLLSLSDWGCMPTSPSDQNGTRIFAYEIESIVIDTFIHVGEMAWKSPYYVRETLIDLAAGHEAHGFALSYFPLPMGGRAVDRSPVSFNGPMCRLLISTSVTWNFIIL